MGILVLFAVLLLYANTLYNITATPLLRLLPPESHLIATAVTTPFITPLKLSAVLALLLGAPLILYQIWAFIAPGLYTHEKRWFAPMLSISIGLFYAGILFAYFVVLPMTFRFFIQVAPEGVQIMTDISAYLDFVLSLCLAFGVAFQLPIITLALLKSGLVSLKTLQAQRPYIIIGAFALAMMLTPPDIISQTMLALPMWGLFELSLFCARFLGLSAANKSQ